MPEWSICLSQTFHCPEYVYCYLYFIKYAIRNNLLTLFCRFLTLNCTNHNILQVFIPIVSAAEMETPLKKISIAVSGW